MRAEDLQFPRHHQVHGDRSRPVEQQADLDVPAAAPQAPDRTGRGGRRSERVHRHVRPALGELDDRRSGITGARIHGERSAELPGPAQRRRRHVDRHHPGPERRTDHHRRQPRPAATVHGQPVAGPHPAVRGDRAEGGGEPAAQARGRDEVDRLGQRDQVRIRRLDRDQFRERSRPGESRLSLPRAHLGVARPAVLAPAAAAHERHGHTVPGPPAGHLGPGLRDHSGQLVPADVRQVDRIVPLPGVPVRPAHPARADRNDHPVRGTRRVRDLRQFRHDPVAGVDQRPHEPDLSPDLSPGLSSAWSSRARPSSEVWYSTVRPLRWRSTSPPLCSTARC